MASVGWTLAGRQSILGILARWLRQRGRRVAAVLAIAARFILIVVGLALLVAAAWVLATPAGLAAAGVACLLLEWVVKRQ